MFMSKAVLLYLLIGSAIWPVDMHTWPIQNMFKFPMVGPQIIPPAQAGNFPEFLGISIWGPTMGEIWQQFSMHEDEERAVVRYACQMGRWRGPDYESINCHSTYITNPWSEPKSNSTGVVMWKVWWGGNIDCFRSRNLNVSIECR